MSDCAYTYACEHFTELLSTISSPIMPILCHVGGDDSAWEAAEDPVAAAKHKSAEGRSEAKDAAMSTEAALDLSADATAGTFDLETLEQLIYDLEYELDTMYCCPLTLAILRCLRNVGLQ